MRKHWRLVYPHRYPAKVEPVKLPFDFEPEPVKEEPKRVQMTNEPHPEIKRAQRFVVVKKPDNPNLKIGDVLTLERNDGSKCPFFYHNDKNALRVVEKSCPARSQAPLHGRTDHRSKVLPG